MTTQVKVSAAQPLFRIATGAPGGTCHRIATAMAMASALSEPGVVKVQAMATSGSIANFNAIASRQMESGFS